MVNNRMGGCSSKLGILFIIFVGIVIVGEIAGPEKTSQQGQSQEASPAAPANPPPEFSETALTSRRKIGSDFKGAVADLRSKGIIYSVDYASGRMRIDSFFWRAANVDFKKNMLLRFYITCHPEKSEGVVKILSDKDDTEFGECDDAWGPTLN